MNIKDKVFTWKNDYSYLSEVKNSNITKKWAIIAEADTDNDGDFCPVIFSTLEEVMNFFSDEHERETMKSWLEDGLQILITQIKIQE